MPGIPIYPYPDYPSDVARRNSAMDNFFDFGTAAGIDFEELNQRDVDSYVGFTYAAPDWYQQNATGGQWQWWVAEWADERRIERLQEHVQVLADAERQFQQHPDRVRMENERQFSRPFHANVPARAAAPRQHAQQTFTAPTAPNHNPPNVPQTAAAPTVPNHNPPNAPQMPAALPSAPAQLAQLPAAPTALPRPTLPPNLPLPLAQRPPPPAGFTDQPRARIPPGSYLSLYRGRPGRNVQWPENIEISLIEIATFCPNWYQNPEVVGRAVRNGWSRENIAKAQLLAEDPTSRDTLDRRSGRIQKQVSTACRMLEDQLRMHRANANALRTHLGNQNDLTANAWNFRHVYDPEGYVLEHFGDMPLSSFYAHVNTWPTGNDRLLMTQCLEFAHQNPERQLDSSHWDWIITSQGLATPPPLANGQHRDVDALQRLKLLPDPQ